VIYRAQKMINWSPHLGSSLSDVEIDLKEIHEPVAMAIPGYDNHVQFGLLHKFAYKLKEPLREVDEVVVATSRIETIFGDTAVAVHPNDPRYNQLVGRTLVHPFLPDRQLQVIADEAVDMDKGTGAVKVTPAHDQVDFEIGLRHNLETVESVDDHGKVRINERLHKISSSVESKKQFEAKEKIIKRLMSQELYRGSINHRCVVRLCGKTGDVIEPRLKDQWFVRVADMCDEAIRVVDEGQIEFIQKKFTTRWRRWLESAEDWCLSRGLQWGHQIPAYKCSNSSRSQWIVAKNREEAEAKARRDLGADDVITIEQDPDVLDTWFSSAIYPFAALGWPNDNESLRKYYPLDVMETGDDLIHFWVARMVMLGTKLTGQVPFKRVLFHPMVCDSYDRKMSKSLGNVIDPMHVVDGSSFQERIESIREMGLTSKENKLAIIEIKKQGEEMLACGSDALRLSLAHFNLQSKSIKYDLHHPYTCRKFLNKIWNSFRLCLMLLRHDDVIKSKLAQGETCDVISDVDVWINNCLLRLVTNCQRHQTNFELSRALEQLQHFWTSNFCDVYLEFCKSSFTKTDDGWKADDDVTAARQLTLVRCCDVFFRLLAPFAPFITEELWQRIPSHLLMTSSSHHESIHQTSYPQLDDVSTH